MKKFGIMLSGILFFALFAFGLSGCNKVVGITVSAGEYTVKYEPEGNNAPRYNVYDGNELIASCVLDAWTAGANGATIAARSMFGHYQLAVRSDYKLKGYNVGEKKIITPMELNVQMGGVTMVAFKAGLSAMPDMIASQISYSGDLAAGVTVKKGISLELDIAVLDIFDVEKWEFIGTEAREVTDENPRENEHFLGRGLGAYAADYAGREDSTTEYCTLVFQKEKNKETIFQRRLKRTGDDNVQQNSGYIVLNTASGNHSMIVEGANDTIISQDSFTYWMGNLCFERELDNGQIAISYFSPATLKLR